MRVYDRRTNKYLGVLVAKYTSPFYAVAKYTLPFCERILWLVDVTGIYQYGWDIEHCPSATLPYKKLLKENRLYWNFYAEECEIKNDILKIE